MTYLLIIFIIALALAPLSHFVPSKRQRHITRLRECAAVHGMFVEFRHLPGASHRRTAASPATRGDIIYYGRRLPPRRTERIKPASWLADSGEWRSINCRGPVPAPLLELPGEILAASVDEASCGIYWQECGGEEEVGQIRRVLESWSGELLS